MAPRARRQFRRSPGGRTPYCSRSIPELPPSSVAATTAVMRHAGGRCRRRASRTTGKPVPPPRATTCDSGRRRLFSASGPGPQPRSTPGGGTAACRVMPRYLSPVLDRLDERAIHLDCDAPLEHVDRDDHETLVWFAPHQHTLHVDEWSTRDP